MSIWRVVVSTVILATAACADVSVAAPDESAVEQATGWPPDCPAGDYLFEWSEPVGACGGCTVDARPGLTFLHFAACSSDLLGTKKKLKATCEPRC
jgi:hypothetical protein